MKNKLLIIGASGHGKVVADIALKMGKWKSVVFLDDDVRIKTSMGIEVIGSSDKVSNHLDEYEIFVGIGNNNIRKKILENLLSNGASVPTMIHPSAVIGECVKIESGSVIMPGAVINCCTKIGKGCIVNTGATIDHDNIIEDFVHVSPGVHLAGTVKIGEESWLGIGSVVSNNVSITSKCKIGAGAIVIKNIDEAGTYVGIPVRKIK